VKKAIQVLAAIRNTLWVAAILFGGAILATQGAEAPIAPGGVGPTSGSSTNTSYIIAPNDLVRFEVYKEPDLTIETRVDQDGTVSLPLVKLVRVGGSSISEARETVRQLYEKDFLVAAHVNIVLVQTSKTNKEPVMVKPKLRFTILGQVKKPGNHEIPEGEKITVVQAIAIAEGFTGIANQKSVTVIRAVNGKTEKYELDVKQMMNDSKAKPFEIKPGDMIDVRQTVF
jgi:polysaccharide export outer membrane protein